MPNWKIHFEIGKRVNEELKFDGEDLNLFLLGNILPDLNNKYIVVEIEISDIDDLQNEESKPEVKKWLLAHDGIHI